ISKSIIDSQSTPKFIFYFSANLIKPLDIFSTAFG
ncbi:unnamed protein product, partial [marine sediment metagenome]